MRERERRALDEMSAGDLGMREVARQSQARHQGGGKFALSRQGDETGRETPEMKVSVRMGQAGLDGPDESSG